MIEIEAETEIQVLQGEAAASDASSQGRCSRKPADMVNA
jgi:hypothetical protein